MTLFRSIGRRRHAPQLSPEWRAQADEEMPPRPQQHEPGPVTAPRLFAPMQPVDPAYDPCGAPPISSSEKGDDR